MGFAKVHIVYFSGTGGTARVAGHLREAFERRGTQVVSTALDGTPPVAPEADLLVVLFPVYAANAPQPIAEWIATAPEGNGKPAAVLSVSGGGEVSPNTACRVSTLRKLERRGYRVVLDRMLVMPSNLLIGYSDALSALLLRAAPAKAQAVADDLLAGRVCRTRPLPWDRLLSVLFRVEHLGSRMFGKQLRANDRCTGCGWCAAHCPRGNITLCGGKPVFGYHCVFCTRCLYGCPAKAIVPGFGQFAILKDGFDLHAVEKRTEALTDFPAVETLTKGAALNGVRKYLLEK